VSNLLTNPMSGGRGRGRGRQGGYGGRQSGYGGRGIFGGGSGRGATFGDGEGGVPDLAGSGDWV
jgi:hypothetical protein